MEDFSFIKLDLTGFDDLTHSQVVRESGTFADVFKSILKSVLIL